MASNTNPTKNDALALLRMFSEAVSGATWGLKSTSRTTPRRTTAAAPAAIPAPVSDASEWPKLSSCLKGHTPALSLQQQQQQQQQKRRLSKIDSQRHQQKVAGRLLLIRRHVAALKLVWQDKKTPPMTFLSGVTMLFVAAFASPSQEEGEKQNDSDDDDDDDYNDYGDTFAIDVNEDAVKFPKNWSALRVYSIEVLCEISPLLHAFPSPIPDALSRLGISTVDQDGTTSRLNNNNNIGTFPTGCFTPSNRHDDRVNNAVDDDSDNKNNANDNDGLGALNNSGGSELEGGVEDEASYPLLPRLRSNLEAVWDTVLALYRRFRGDMPSSVSRGPGVLKAIETTRAMAALHPANCDAFAARLVSLIARTARAPPHAPDKLRQLDTRFHNNNMNPTTTVADTTTTTSTTTSATNQNDSNFTTNAGVVLHRAPKQVREAFEKEHIAHLFFLDFLICADSARLCTAMAPRLSVELFHSIGKAARATSASAFCDAVTEARLHAKLLSTVLHLGNWAHSSAAMSGGGGGGVPLPKRVRRARVGPHGAYCESLLNVSRLVEDAMKSQEATAITAAAAVTADVVRFAELDPVARDTWWHREAKKALSKTAHISPLLRVVTGTHVTVGENEAEENDDDGETDMVLELKNGNGNVYEHSALVADVRLVRAVARPLDEMRRAIVSLLRGGRVQDSIMRTMMKSMGIRRNEHDEIMKVKKHDDRPTTSRRITPVAQGNVGSSGGGGDHVMTDAHDHDTETENNKQMENDNDNNNGRHRHEITKDDDNRNNVDASLDDDDDDDDENNLDDENNRKKSAMLIKLEREFFARIDGRIRELVGVVVCANGENDHTPRDSFLQVVSLLYPRTPSTVAAVAAEACAKRVRGSSNRGGGGKRRDSLAVGGGERKAIEKNQKRGKAVGFGERPKDAKGSMMNSVLERRMMGGRSHLGQVSSLGVSRVQNNNKIMDIKPP